MKTTNPLVGTERQIAEALNVDRTTVHAAIREANITPTGRSGAHPVYLVRAVVDAIAPRTGDGTIDIDRLPPNARDTYIRSERNLIRLRKERGELLHVDDVADAFSDVFKHVAHTFDTLPDILERDVGLDRNAIVRTEGALDVARTELHRRINLHSPQSEAAP